MNTIKFSAASVTSMFQGQVIGPENPEYHAARTVFAGGIDKKPALIIRAANIKDVQNCIRLSRETGMELAIRSGGHSSAGHGVSEGGIVLDLTRMKAMDVNPGTRTAWAETGLTAGEFTNAAAVHKLATGFGDTGSVGIGGITTGGGIGYLSRKYGMTIDNVTACEIVTADGSFHTVDETHEPDLFWAVRGGGGNFGVVTRFQYRIHDVETVTGGMLILPASAKNIAAFIHAAEQAPDELSTIANVMTAPPMPFLPKETTGKLIIMALMCYAGDATSGASVMAKFRSIDTPLADMVKVIPYPQMYPPDQGNYHPIAAARTMFIDRVDERTADDILTKLRASTGTMAVCQLRVLGGAIARILPDATAYYHRKSTIMVNLATLYQNLEEKMQHELWVTDFQNRLQQNDYGAYVNFLGNEPVERIHAAYPGTTWERLQKIKTKYDPANVFHLNQNIPPSLEDARL